MNICIVTPIFGVQAGGAAKYYNILTEKLCQFNAVTSITVITEKGATKDMASKFSDAVEIRDIFPNRASALPVGLRYFFRLLLQNIFFFDPRILKTFRNADVIIIHSSFFNIPNFLFFPSVFFRSKSIIDVRDTQIPLLISWQLLFFKRFITCSRNCFERLTSIGLSSERITEIPVVIDDRDPLLIPSATTDAVHQKLRKKIFVIGLVKRNKGCVRVLESMLFLESDKYELHLIGAIKDQEICDKFSRFDNIFFHGAVAHDVLLKLLKEADLLVSASSSEGMPRSILEAMFLGVQVLVPECVTEFQVLTDDSRILDDDLGQEIARKINLAFSKRDFNPVSGYDYTRHSVEKVIPIYEALLADVVSGTD